MKCKNCGRQMSDDARFCEMCGTPVGAEKTQAADAKPEVDPHYDLSVFSDDSDMSPKPPRRHTPAHDRGTYVEDDAAKTELLPENDDRFFDLPKRSARRHAPERIVEDDASKTELLPENDDRFADLPKRPARRHAPARIVEDDAAKTELLPENEAQPVVRNRFEENIEMHRRYRDRQKRSDFVNQYDDPPRRDNDPLDAGAYRDEYRGYQPVGQGDYRDSYPDDYDDSTRDIADYRNDYDDSTRYDADYREERYADRQSRDKNRYDSRRTGGRYSEPPKNNKKKALIISIIALILVIAILGGVIFFVNRNTVSAAELQDAKEKYLPPSQAVTIDTSLDDPSNDDITFQYDNRARIISCSYSANKKPYEQHYTYRDPERQLDIETTYRNKPIETKVISYDEVTSANDFEDIGGYYVRLDDESMTGSGNDTAPATDMPTEAPTSAPTEATISEENISDYPQLEAFLSYYTMWGPDEYDARNVLGNERNMLMSVANYYSCVDPKNYPGNGVKTIDSNEASQIWPWDTKRMGLAAFDKTEADWICKNIFNITDVEIETMYNDQYNSQYMYADDSYYYTLWGGKGSVVSGKLQSIKTDGRFYYVVYDIYAANVYNESHYAVMEFKNIDGAEYWSMYYHSATVPDEITPFDSEGR